MNIHDILEFIKLAKEEKPILWPDFAQYIKEVGNNTDRQKDLETKRQDFEKEITPKSVADLIMSIAMLSQQKGIDVDEAIYNRNAELKKRWDTTGSYLNQNKMKDKEKLEKEASEKPGLWANIRAKRKRGEPAAKPGDKDYPDKEQWKELTKEATLTTMDNTLALLGIEKLASSPAWQRSEGKNREGGLNAKGRASYNRATGGNLKAPVTEKKPKGKRAKRRKSFCGRMCGMKRVNTGAKAKRDPDSRINKSLRKWNCKCGSGDFDLFGLAELIKEAKAMKKQKRCWDGYKPVKGKKPYSEDSCEKA